MRTRFAATPTMAWPYDHLTAILQEENDALLKRILQLALNKGFTDQTSSMRAAWQEANDRLNDCLVAYLNDPLQRGGLDGRNDYRKDPRFQNLRDIAQRHHDAGVPIELHHGLFKLYRKAYLETFRAVLQRRTQDRPTADDNPTAHADEVLADEVLGRIDDFFDEADQAMLAPWASRAPAEAGMADRLRRLTRERDQYFGVLESLRGPVFITDEDGQLITANATALQTFVGLSEAGALTYRLAMQAHRTRLQVVVDEVIAADAPLLSAIWLQTHEGSRCFDIRLRLIEDSVYKLDRCRIILMHDVTEHLQAIERAQRAERTMSMFMATMSHEIRGPLHSVLGAAELLQDATPAEAEALLDLLNVSARALNATLENVLSFSRFEHQAPQPRPEKLLLHKALDDLIRVKEIQARQQGVPLILQCVPNLPEDIVLDWSMTQQILGNLIQNALRHDDGRGVLLQVDANERQLIFQVSDHGPGLPDDVQQLFIDQPAELRPRITDRNGTGLGLAIAQRMTLALGGEIHSLPSQSGALLEVRLPLLHATTVTDPPPVRSAATPIDKTCLLVDDDPIGALGTIAMLERLSLSVDHVGTLAQARALCQAAPDTYDFFIVDLRLPDGTGIDFARSLRDDPQLKDRPVLLLSANLDLLAQQPEAKTLFAAVLEKPLDAAALGRAIRTGTARPGDVGRSLDGISPAVQQRMAAAFAENWWLFQSQLAETDAEYRSAHLADQAHKLASGAALFGLTGLTQALRALERACDSPPAGERTDQPWFYARAALLRWQLPEGWGHGSRRGHES
ncbi:MAG: histidine kinase dimerization/phospho-acceptor domain-containing protein [Lautropia sp.]|nr:histidine kinase dimerization/phospho-acceptor domain-containing protein [Lautropia sp.]